ncbi:Ran-binding protein, putative [Bodo saltans]|uniref:Ran-binding protein, putative n=1 Tax=Bodo saltans TaxID=75058 RepID=A0A0S4JIB8_BODSA|nr:Ran-binding protein, putative [Bodo saltans]|eukprot:CUG88147.1 Ran-binding protein, putative [Bodo saltans]
MPLRELYGGAMACQVAERFEDVSQFRQVPDNQEVFTDVATGTCIIVELMARQASVPNEGCGEFFFHDLAQSNGSSSNAITIAQRPLTQSEVPLMAARAATGVPCEYACMIAGSQSISKFTNEGGRENTVFVAMIILRLPSPVSTDILISASAPQQIAEGSSEARVAVRIASHDEVVAELMSAVSTMTVRDWGLFVPE